MSNGSGADGREVEAGAEPGGPTGPAGEARAGEPAVPHPAGLQPAVLRAMIDQALRRVRRWRLPLNWSRRDWSEEAEAQAVCCAWQAVMRFDPCRGVALGQFVQSCVLADVLARYRRERSYASRRAGPEAAASAADPGAAGAADDALALSLLREAVAALPAQERWVLLQVYTEARSDGDVARELGIRKQSFHERRHNILAALRAALGGGAAGAGDDSEVPS